MIGASAATVLAAAAAAPASADHHGICQPAGGSLPNLVVDGTDFVFSATTACGLATGLTISNLQIVSALAPAFGSSGAAPDAACSPCDTLTASGRVPAQPGVYRVTYSFTVVSALGTAAQRRASTWTWAGAGATRAACRRDGPPQGNTGC